MAKTPDNSNGPMNGTTEVVLVPDPGASVQNVFSDARFENKDTVQHTISVYLKDGSANLLKIGEALVLEAGVGAPLAIVGMVTVKNGETVVAKMLAAHTTTAPRRWSSWINCT